MISYTFKNQVSGIEALKAIVGKRYAYILDTIDTLYKYADYTTLQGTCETSLDVWIGSSGMVHIDFSVTTTDNKHYRYCYARFIIDKTIKSLTVLVKFKYGNDREREYISYKDIEIPKKTKLGAVFMRCM